MRRDNLSRFWWSLNILLSVVAGLAGCATESGLRAGDETGIRWHKQTAPNYGGLYGAAWSGTQFVAVGPNVILTSPNGITWTERKALGGWWPDLFGIVWSGSQFVIVGYDPRHTIPNRIPVILTSPDGIAWTHREAPGGPLALNSVAWSGSQFVAVGSNSHDLSPVILTSPDGITWTQQRVPVFGQLHAITWGGGQFVVVGAESNNGLVLTSPDGVEWTRQTVTSDQHWEAIGGIIWSETQYVAVGYGATRDSRSFSIVSSTILTSPDGITWTRRKIPVNGLLEGIAWGRGQFIAVGTVAGSAGNEPLILTSRDGVTWARSASSTRGHPRSIVWSGSQFVIVGQIRGYIVPSYSPLILTSP